MVNNWRVALPWPEGVTTEGQDIENLYEDKDGKTKSVFDSGLALAAMILNGAIFLNSHHWEKEWPEAARGAVAVCVNTNDVFAWGCADAEGIGYSEIEEVYRYWVKDRGWGCAVWAIVKTKQLPQEPVAKDIRKAGIWDLDALQKEHGIRANHYDGVSIVLAQRKHDAYLAWCAEIGEESLNGNGSWWKGWDKYIAAHPDWYDDAWKAADKAARAEWRRANGYGDEEQK